LSDREREIENVVIPIAIFSGAALLGFCFLGWW
jgi:hypothetical protein